LPWHAWAGTAWFGPQIGVIALLVFTAFGFEAKPATIWGAVTWLASWLVSGFLYRPFTTPDRANARSQGELLNKIATVKARRHALCEVPPTPPVTPSANLKSACSEAAAHLDWVEKEIAGHGEWRWVNGAAYIALWERLHRAEEALLAATPKDHLLDEALYDELRLKDSAIPNRDDLMGILRSVKRYLSHGPDKTTDPYIEDDEAAASALTQVRFSVNDFRDSSWNGLLQLRNQTMTTLLLTNIVLFAFAAVAVNSGAQRSAMLAATVFYLVGAVIGLFNRLNKQFQAQAAVEDYGLTNARLAAIPVYSGLAAIAGVLITVVAQAATAGTTPGVATAARLNTALSLNTVFSLPPATALLVVAAAFGAAPDLVLSRLADASEKFKNGIASTEPGNRQPSR
jgi:hypothetical protein